MIANQALAEGAKIVTGLNPAVPSSSTPDYVSLKGYGRATVIIQGINTTGATGPAITLKQATAVAGTSEKALAFSQYWANTDTNATDTLVLTNAVSNTFNVTNTASKAYLYVIEVKSADLDVTNSFDCVRCGTGDATNSTCSVTYILRDPRYADATPPAAITD